MKLPTACRPIPRALIALATLAAAACGPSPSSQSSAGSEATGSAVHQNDHQGTTEIEPPSDAASWQPSGENIIPNPSLETNMDGWHGNGIKRVESAADAHTGKAGLEVDTSAEHPYDGAYYAASNFVKFEAGPGVTCKPDTDYIASVWVKGLKDYDGVDVQLHIFASDKTNYLNTKIPLTGEWQKVEHRFRTVDGAAPLGVAIVKSNSAQPVQYAVDDLEIVPAKP